MQKKKRRKKKKRGEEKNTHFRAPPILLCIASLLCDFSVLASVLLWLLSVLMERFIGFTDPVSKPASAHICLTTPETEMCKSPGQVQGLLNQADVSK